MGKIASREKMGAAGRTALAFALTNAMVWGAFPAAAVAEAAEAAEAEPSAMQRIAQGSDDAAREQSGSTFDGVIQVQEGAAPDDSSDARGTESDERQLGEEAEPSARALLDEVVEPAAEVAEETTYSGSWGTCEWTIDSAGTLTIGAGEGETTASGRPSWHQYRDSIKAITGTERIVAPQKCAGLFSGYHALTTCDLSGWDTSGVTDMNNMFSSCSNIASLDLSGWDTSKVENMEQMFQNCGSLVSLGVSGWNTSSVTNMKNMFLGCAALASLDASGWVTSKVTTMEGMFFSCESLASLEISDWDTSQVTTMEGMFHANRALTSLDLSGWDTSSATNMSAMFRSCTALASIDVSGWDTSNVTTVSQMFVGCSALTSLDLSDWDTSNVTQSGSYTMLSGCSSLSKISVGPAYFFKSSDMLPDPYGQEHWGMWRSCADNEWYPKSHIVSNRSGVADTYVITEVTPVAYVSVDTPEPHTYTGEPITPEPAVTYGGNTLTRGVDYVLSYSKNIDAGTATITVTGMGAYEDETSVMFEITPAPIDVPGAAQGLVYDGLEQVGVAQGPGYVLSGTARATNAGDHTATVTPDANHCWKDGTTDAREIRWTIARKPVTVTAKDNTKTYGQGDPTLTATTEGTVGTDGVAYTMSREAGEDVGEYPIYPSGDAQQGNYDVTYAPGKLTIGKASITKAAISAIPSQAYTGKAVTPRPTVRVGSRALRPNVDFTLRYANNVKAGTATVTVTGKGNYAGSASATFKIVAPSASYRSHLQGTGDQRLVSGGQMSGTTGQSRRLEAVWITLGEKPLAGSVRYRAHLQGTGDQDWRSEGQMCGTTGQSRRMEAIQIELTGKMAESYDVYYRAHVQRIGWMGWAKNGAWAGTAGRSRRLEALQIVIVPKGAKAPAVNFGGQRQDTGSVFLRG